MAYVGRLFKKRARRLAARRAARRARQAPPPPQESQPEEAPPEAPPEEDDAATEGEDIFTSTDRGSGSPEAIKAAQEKAMGPLLAILALWWLSKNPGVLRGLTLGRR